MKYYKKYKEEGARPFEITKAEARKTLTGHWKEECLEDIFKNKKGFCLDTPFAVVWTKTDDGLVPIAGFVG